MALNVTALVLSLAAVIISVRQTVYVRQSNHLPLIVDILREFRSPDFQKDYSVVLTSLDPEGPACALSQLRDAEKRAALTVAYFFQSIAYLVVYGIMGEEMVIATFQTSIRRSWNALRPYIEQERIQRDSKGQFGFFERLAEQAEKVTMQKVWPRRKLQYYH